MTSAPPIPLMRGVTMRATHAMRGALLAACLSAIAATSLLAQAGPSCPSKTSCAETASFVANVTDFRTSVSGRYRIVATTIHFTNKLNHSLILGYVPGSGITTDDRGNRYSIGGPSNVRGIGLISSGALDVKFILQPGESSDARFEFGWQPGNEIYGTAYEVELAIREIDPVSEHQYTLGKEHWLRFSGFGSAPSVAAASPAPVASSSAGAAAAAAVAPIVDACAGRSKCYGSGPFVAEWSQSRSSHDTQVPQSYRAADHPRISCGIEFDHRQHRPALLLGPRGSARYECVRDRHCREQQGRPTVRSPTGRKPRSILPTRALQRWQFPDRHRLHLRRRH